MYDTCNVFYGLPGVRVTAQGLVLPQGVKAPVRCLGNEDGAQLGGVSGNQPVFHGCPSRKMV